MARTEGYSDGRVPLHEGMLSRAGWYLLDELVRRLT
jgi:hypothetical protein